MYELFANWRPAEPFGCPRQGNAIDTEPNANSLGWKEPPSLCGLSDEAAPIDAGPQLRFRADQVPASASSEASRVLVGLPMRAQEPRS
jgi:hypothetical protein